MKLAKALEKSSDTVWRSEHSLNVENAITLACRCFHYEPSMQLLTNVVTSGNTMLPQQSAIVDMVRIAES